MVLNNKRRLKLFNKVFLILYYKLLLCVKNLLKAIYPFLYRHSKRFFYIQGLPFFI